MPLTGDRLMRIQNNGRNYKLYNFELHEYAFENTDEVFYNQ